MAAWLTPLSWGAIASVRFTTSDAVLNDNRGGVATIPNAICMHEEDYSILWKHVDMRTGKAEVRRSRRLVISSISTVGNYEYGFYWYFYQDGTIQYEVKLTGIVNTAAVPPGEVPKYGALIAPQLNAHIHQHFFNVRLDMNVDGEGNSAYEVNTVAEPLGQDNPHGNAFFTESTLLATESEAQRNIDPMTGRYWVIANPSGTERRRSARGLQAHAGREHPTLCPSQRERNQARRLYHEAPVGYSLQPR